MYQVINARRISTEVGLINVAKHNSREEIYNEDLTKKDPQKFPEWLKNTLSDAEKRLQSNGKRASDVLSIRKEKMQNLARKPQKNASAAIEFVVSASHEFEGNWQEYFEKSKEFLVKKYGDNIISCAVHADETTPHMHILFVPIIEKDGKKRYSSSNFLGKRDDLKKLHTEFYNEVGQLFGLERGEENSRARHDGVKEFSKKIKDIDRKEKSVSERENKLTAREEEVSSAEKKLNTRQAIIVEHEKHYDEFKKDLEEYSKKYIGTDIKNYRDVIPDFDNKLWQEVNSEDSVKKNFDYPKFFSWKTASVEVAKFVVGKSKEFAKPFQDEFNKLYDRLKKATSVIKNLTDGIRQLSQDNEKLKNENAELTKQNKMWREQTNAEQFREIADMLDKSKCQSWKQYLEEGKKAEQKKARNRSSGISY